MKEKPDRPLYEDYIFRPAACLLAAHVIVMMGRPDLTTFEAFEKPSYYPTLVINFIIALIVGLAVKKVTVALDKRYPWYKDIWRRAMLQFAFGVLAVSILSYLLVLIYFISFGQDIVESGYLHYELPFSTALITILNFYYVTTYFYRYAKQTLVALNPVETITPIGDRENLFEETDLTQIQHLTIIDEVVPESSTELVSGAAVVDQVIPEESVMQKNREILIIDTPKRSIPIRVADVVMFFIIDSTVFVRMKDMKSFNDCFQFDMYLSDIMELIGGEAFFRLNRKCIVNFDTIGSFRNLTDRSLIISLKPEFEQFENIDAAKWDKLFTVSGEKVFEFKSWMNR